MNSKSVSDKSTRGFAIKGAAGHWWYQRLTAVALVPLSLWLLILLNKALTASYDVTLNWLTSPFNALAIAAWIVVAFYHAALGVQVVIEDYVSTLPVRQTAIRTVNAVFLFLAVVALLAMAFIVIAR